MATPRPESAAWRPAWACLVALGVTSYCGAGTVEVRVTDEEGRPVERVAVYATRAGVGTASEQEAARDREPRSAVIDQHDNRFVPHLLVVQTGTEVLFPNNDVVSHHVYSFSPTKTFELGLYKGDAHPPLAFDEPGVVVLGCNIHDGMLGYLLVVATPHFALTDERGVAKLDELAAGEYTVEAWSPRARPAGLPAAQLLSIGAGSSPVLDLQLTGRLAPEHDHSATSLSWDRY